MLSRMSRLQTMAIIAVFAMVVLAASLGHAQERVTITLATDIPWFEEDIKKPFEDAHPGIEVEFVYIPGSLNEGLLRFAASGTMPDMFSTHHHVLPGLIEHGLVTPLEPFISRDDSVDLSDYVGLNMGVPGLWTLPLTVNSWFMMYNSSLFDQMGLAYPQQGWTMDEFYDIAMMLTADTTGAGVPNRFGFGGFDPIYNLNSAEVMLRPFGANLFDTEGRPTIDTPEMRDALWFWSDLTSRIMAPQTPYQLNTQWKSGDVGMMVADRVHLPTIAADPSVFEWGLAHMPTEPDIAPHTVGTGHYFAMSSTTPHPEAVWAWMKWVTGPEGHQAMETRGLLPAHRDAFHYYDAFWDSRRTEWNVPDNVQVILEATAYITPPSIVASHLALETVGPIWFDHVSKAMKLELPVENATAEMQRVVSGLQASALGR